MGKQTHPDDSIRPNALLPSFLLEPWGVRGEDGSTKTSSKSKSSLFLLCLGHCIPFWLFLQFIARHQKRRKETEKRTATPKQPIVPLSRPNSPFARLPRQSSSSFLSPSFLMLYHGPCRVVLDHAETEYRLDLLPWRVCVTTWH